MYGLRRNGITIPLPSATSIRIDRYSALFVDTGEFSFPFDLPITPELKRALNNVDFNKAILYSTEYIFDVIDAGITRYPQVNIILLGKANNKLKVNITIGTSKISKWMKETRLRDLDLGSVTLNGDPVQKFVVFEFAEPISGMATTGSFGMAVNGDIGASSVPYNTDMETTIADWVAFYNGGSLSAMFQNIASQPASNQIRFDANYVSGNAPLDWSSAFDSIGDANLPTNFGDPWTVAIVGQFDYTYYTQQISDAAADINLALTAATADDQEICFPVIYNPKFISEELDDPAAEFCGYLNYTNTTTIAQNYNVNSDGTRWKYHLSPCIVAKWLLTKIFSLNQFSYSDDFSAENDGDILLFYSNKGVDQVYVDSNDKTDDFPLGKTYNMYAGIINLIECVPDITVGELIGALKTWSNLLVRLNDVSHQVEITRIDPIFDHINDEVQDLSLEEDPEDDFDIALTSGVTLQLTQDGDDDLSSALVKDHRTFNLSAAVNTYNALPAAGSSIGELRYVNNLNQYYRYNGAGWELYAEGVDDFVTGDVTGDTALTITTGLGTLFTFFGIDINASPRRWTVPYAKQTGNHLRPGFVPSANFATRILFWRGLQEDELTNHYYLANNHFQINNGSLDVTYSCCYYGTKGKYETDYRRWYEFIKLARNCFKTFYLPLGKQNLLDLSKWIGANGKRYLIKRISQSLPYSRTVLIECLQKAASEGALFTVNQYCCSGDGAFVITPIIPGGIFTGDGISFYGGDWLFDQAAAGLGPHVITYTIGQTSFSQTIEVKPLPVVSLAPLASVAHTHPPYTLTGGSPLGGAWYCVDVPDAITGDEFDPGIAGAGGHEIIYSFTSEFGCTAFDNKFITVT